MRLLDRPRPDVDLAVLLEAAVPWERFGCRPRLEDQLAVLAGAVARLDRREGGVQVRVVAEPDGEAGDQPAAADAIQQRVLLGDLQRLARLPERPAEDGDRHVEARCLRGAGDRRGQQGRVGRNVVGGLAVLGHADTVEAGSRAVQQLRVSRQERLLHPPGLDELVRRGYHRAVLLLEALGYVAVWHLLKQADLHGRLQWCMPLRQVPPPLPADHSQRFNGKFLPEDFQPLWRRAEVY